MLKLDDCFIKMATLTVSKDFYFFISLRTFLLTFKSNDFLHHLTFINIHPHIFLLLKKKIVSAIYIFFNIKGNLKNLKQKKINVTLEFAEHSD